MKSLCKTVRIPIITSLLLFKPPDSLRWYNRTKSSSINITSPHPPPTNRPSLTLTGQSVHCGCCLQINNTSINSVQNCCLGCCVFKFCLPVSENGIQYNVTITGNKYVWVLLEQNLNKVVGGGLGPVIPLPLLKYVT